VVAWSYNRRVVGKEHLMPLPPPLSAEQRRRALEKAAEARRKRAAIKKQLKEGTVALEELLRRAREGDEIVGKIKVSAVLESLPGIGKVRSLRIMERLGISKSRRLRGLGDKQAGSLLKEFSRR
jgi:hypothetical protein